MIKTTGHGLNRIFPTFSLLFLSHDNNYAIKPAAGYDNLHKWIGNGFLERAEMCNSIGNF